MPRLLILLLLPAASACASGPSDSTGADPAADAVRRLRAPGAPDEVEAEAEVAAFGDAALPALREALANPEDSRYRSRAARALARIWKESGSPAALEAYIEAVQKAPNDPHARGLLAEAHRFRRSEGRVLALLTGAIENLRIVTPEMVAAAAAMTDVEALDAMMRLVGKTVDEPSAPERDAALRYIGRAARRGRREAVEFLRACTQAANPDLVEKAGAELSLLAGRISPKSWSAWWLDHNGGNRKEWLVEAWSPFDPTDRAQVGEFVSRLPRDGDPEAEMWFLERVLGRSFGYFSPRDVFDPDLDPAALASANRRAIETARDWWRENEPYLYFNEATGRFDISEEARRIGVPVDPRTGKPGR